MFRWVLHLAQEWTKASNVARGFQIGPLEAKALMALQNGIDPVIAKELRSAVARRGMRNFCTHEMLAKGVLSTAFSSASGPSEPWSGQLTNGSDLKLVSWLNALFCCENIVFFLIDE